MNCIKQQCNGPVIRGKVYSGYFHVSALLLKSEAAE